VNSWVEINSPNRCPRKAQDVPDAVHKSLFMKPGLTNHRSLVRPDSRKQDGLFVVFDRDSIVTHLAEE
jgi:hypothetical protein